ncbi:MAG: glycosyltransferase family 4 protein [Sulfurisoma sp.]|nr:glycosyltransferase family 4 protein [Sulfurisoma sp.]
MRVLALTRYTRLGASSRMRFHQYAPFLRAHAIDVRFAHFFSDDYLMALYANGKRRGADIVVAYLRRLRDLFSSGDYDVIWLEKEILPWLPAWAEENIAARGIPLVVDYDDAIFHGYDLNKRACVRRFLGRKIDHVMRVASVVVCGNGYLAHRAAAAGANRVETIPTVIDLDRYILPAVPAGNRPFTIGWIGSPATEGYLEAVKPALDALCRDGHCRVLLVGASTRACSGLAGVEVRAWSEEREAADIAEFDVGIMPLPDGPWERGKCGYKLIQYMALGKPVVASPVGANNDIVISGENGFFATGPAQWREVLGNLRDDPVRRRVMGEYGRRQVEQCYCARVTAPRLVSILLAAGAKRHARVD